MSIRAYKWSIGILLCVIALLTWRCFGMFGQMVAASFVHKQCETTRRMFIESELSDLRGLAMRLQFLKGYYSHYGRTLAGSHIAPLVDYDYQRTLKDAVTAFRSWTTNDLGGDVEPWIQKYGAR